MYSSESTNYFLINIDNISICNETLEIKITEKFKTTGLGRFQPLLRVPDFTDNPNICPATALVGYMNKTKNIRSHANRLFITFKRPYHAASSQSISRWIKQTLEDSGINTNIFSAHSTRHASTSLAERQGINIDIIRKTAGWTKSSCSFAKFYNRPIVGNDLEFAKTILQSTKNK